MIKIRMRMSRIMRFKHDKGEFSSLPKSKTKVVLTNMQ